MFAALLVVGALCVAGREVVKRQVINPANEACVGNLAAGTADDVDAAVKAARAAFARGTWSRTSGAARAVVLRAIATGVRDHKAELARLETIDCGKPIDEAEWDMDDVAGCFDYYAGLAEELDARQDAPLALPDARFSGRTRHEPLGVVGAITPWNYPLLMATWKVAPALAAGCCVVLKPSELSSLTCLELAAIATAAGVPPGVLNVITGLGSDAGAALASHPGLSKVAFTGSTASGRAVMRAASAHATPVSLELGGKSALVVFDDAASIPAAVEWAMFGAFWTNGQICSATSRLLLHEAIAPAFLAELAKQARAVRVCDPLERDSRLGPVVSATQHGRVLSYIDSAKKEGATLLTGGKVPPGLPLGYWIEPTVFTNVQPHMKIWKEEVFGPVLAVATFRDEADAVRLANDSVYGLAAAVISGDPARCARLARAFEAGIVWVNCSQPCFCQSPWGGVKRSGFGRELGQWGLDNYLSVKSITTYESGDQWGWYPGFNNPTAPAPKL